MFGDKSESDEELLAAIEAIDPSVPQTVRGRGRAGRGSRGTGDAPSLTVHRFGEKTMALVKLEAWKITQKYKMCSKIVCNHGKVEGIL